MTPFPSPPKTFADFETFRKKLASETFKAKSGDPISIGLERCAFEAAQMHKLLQAAEKIEGVTIKKRIPGWQGKLRRIEESRNRFQALLDDRKNAEYFLTAPSIKGTSRDKTQPSQ